MGNKVTTIDVLKASSKAVDALMGQGVKHSHQFTSKVDYLSYIDIQLTRYATQSPVVKAFPVADELGLKRWEQRWQASRQRHEPTSGVSQVLNHAEAA